MVEVDLTLWERSQYEIDLVSHARPVVTNAENGCDNQERSVMR